MSIQNSSPTSERTPSSPSQVLPAHRPAEEKARHRSIVPTVLSLLVDVVADHVTSNVHSAEPQPGGISDAIERHTDCTSWSEDISVREDEDGVRSHHCPLEDEMQGVRRLGDWPDFNELWTGVLIASDEIPCMVAEKPYSSSESDDDSSVFCYAPLRNEPPMEVGSRLLLPQKKGEAVSPRGGPVTDEGRSTVEAWASEQSSDDEFGEYCRKDLGTRFKTCFVGEDSDMEEFEETVKDVQRRELFKRDRNLRDVSVDCGSLLECKTGEGGKSNADSEKGGNSGNEGNSGIVGNSENVGNSDANGNAVTAGEQGSRGVKEAGNDSDDRPGQTDLSPKAGVENGKENATTKLESSKDTVLKRPSDVEEKQSDAPTNLAPVEDSKPINSSWVVEEEKSEEKEPNVSDICCWPAKTDGKDEGTIIAMCSPVERRTGDIPKHTNGRKHSVESELDVTGLRKNEKSQPHLATSLRFVTEVHHAKGPKNKLTKWFQLFKKKMTQKS